METNTYESTKMNMEMNANDYANNAKGEYPLAFIIDIEVNPQVLKSRARIFKSCYEEWIVWSVALVAFHEIVWLEGRTQVLIKDKLMVL